jgi:hypothetical protein
MFQDTSCGPNEGFLRADLERPARVSQPVGRRNFWWPSANCSQLVEIPISTQNITKNCIKSEPLQLQSIQKQLN